MAAVDPRELMKAVTRAVQLGRPHACNDHSDASFEAQATAALLPDSQSVPGAFVLELAAKWRENFMPHSMNPRYKREWNLFLVLEAGYFFPFRRGQAVPANPGQLGVLLSDREHVALVIADGNERLAASYLAPKYEDFWRSIVPDDEALPTTTVRARIDRAFRLLASAFNGHPRPAPLPVAVAPEEPRPRPTQAQLPLPREGPLSRFLECGLPEEPNFVPNEWRSVFQTDHLGHLTIIRDRTGTGKTQLLRWLTHEIRRAGATPLYVSLPSYAGHAREDDILTHVSTHGPFGDRYADPGSAADLQRELAEEERKGMLVVLADCPDEVFDSELATVDTRLSTLSHVVVAERCHALPTDLGADCVLEMPRLERDSLDALLTAAGSPAGFSSEAMDEIRHFGLGSNLGLLVAAAGVPQQVRPARQVRIGVEQWIDQRLRATRQVVGQTTELLVARKLLGLLAATEVGLHGPGHSHDGLPAQRIEYALRCLDGWGDRDGSFAVLSFLRRTGIVNPSRSYPLLSYPHLCFLLIPEYPAGVGLR